MSGSAKFKFLPISSFRRVSHLIGVSGLLPPKTKIPVYTGMLPCLVPQWLPITQLGISFRSRSDLALVADHALDFLSDLAFQACISFYSVSDKSGA